MLKPESAETFMQEYSEPNSHWFESLAEHLREAYLRYSFARNSAEEVEQVIGDLDLRPGDRVLDVGCGPGRHALELGRRGIRCIGVDISEEFVKLAAAQAQEQGLEELVSFKRGDARALNFDSEFDGVISLCEGAFGLQGGPARADLLNLDNDCRILQGMAQALKPGRSLLVAGFSAYFQIANASDDGSEFDSGTATRHETTQILDPDEQPSDVELWTTCFTARELWLMAKLAGLDPLEVRSIHSGENWKGRGINSNEAELLMLARRPQELSAGRC